jgi:hypothetical protein
MRGEAGAVGGVSEIVLRKPSDWPRLVRERRAWTACVCWLPDDGGRTAAALAAGPGSEVPLTWTTGTGGAAREAAAAFVVRPLLGEDVPFGAGAASAMERGRGELGLTQRSRDEGGRRGALSAMGRCRAWGDGTGGQARPRRLFENF